MQDDQRGPFNVAGKTVGIAVGKRYAIRLDAYPNSPLSLRERVRVRAASRALQPPPRMVREVC